MDKVYRTLPIYFYHPRNYKRLTRDQFDIIKKHKIVEGPPLCPGHQKTRIYFDEGATQYILEIITDTATYYVETPCTFKPNYSIGMDSVDGNLAEDAEAWLLNQELGEPFNRHLDIFGDSDKIAAADYMKIVGLPSEEDILNAENVVQEGRTVTFVSKKKRKWWQFW